MLPFLVLITALLAFRVAGAAGLPVVDDWLISLRAALAVMFLLTASAHWGKRRPDLIRMVPPGFPRPDLLVTITGVLEILGAVGLLVPATTRVAAVCLALLLIAMFPANIHAARRHVSIASKPTTNLGLRTALQVVFVAMLAASAFVVKP